MGKTFLVVVLPVLVGATAIAVFGILRRKVMKTQAISPLQYLMVTTGIAMVSFGILHISLWGLTMPITLPGFWTAVACGVGANTLIQFFNVKAASIDKGEVSLTAPLQAMTPGLITGLAIVLGEYPSRIGVAGIVLIALGSYVLLWEKTPTRWYEYLGPVRRLVLLLKLGHLSPAERNKTIVVSLALASAAMGTIGLLFDGLYTRRGINMQGLVFASWGFMLMLLLVYCAWYAILPDAKLDQRFSAVLSWKIALPILVIGCLWVVINLTIQPTFNRTYVAYTGTLKRLSILMSVVLGYYIFREEDFRKRLWAAILIVAGVLLIASDNLPARLSTRIEGLGL